MICFTAFKVNRSLLFLNNELLQQYNFASNSFHGEGSYLMTHAYSIDSQPFDQSHNIKPKQTEMITNFKDYFKKALHNIKRNTNVHNLEIELHYTLQLKELRSKKENELQNLKEKLEKTESELLKSDETDNNFFRKKRDDEDYVFSIYEQFILVEQQLITIDNILG